MARKVNSSENKTRKSKTSRNSKVQRESQKFSKSKVEDRDAEYNAHSKENDSAWYAQNAQLMSDVASFSYNYPVGSQMPYDANLSRFVRNGSVPGILTIHTTPRFGKLTQANDPINVAMRNVYSFVRHANSGATNYEAPDLMLYLMAMDSCFSFIETLKRVYGTILTYSFTNRYFPVAAVHAQGFNFQSLQENISDFRAYINSLAVKVGSMCIPASMSYMARHMWMYSGMYYDTPNNNKAQVYMYVPEAFYRFNQDEDGAGCLTLLDFDRNKYSSDYVYPRLNPADGIHGWTYEDIVAFGNAMIDPIIADEDMNIMSGDILKAFGAQNVYQVSSIPENYTVLPVYSQEVLEQIHNTSLIGRAFQPSYPWDSLPTASQDNSIVQSADKTYLLNKPKACFILPMQEPENGYGANDFVWGANNYFVKENFDDAWSNVNAAKRLLDFESGPVTPAQAMVASRLSVIADRATLQLVKAPDTAHWVGVKYHGLASSGDNRFWFISDIDSCGSETAGYAKMWYWAKVGYTDANTWSLIHTEDIYNGMFNVHCSPVPTEAAVKALDPNWIGNNVFNSQRIGLLSTFNMHPAVSIIDLYESTEDTITINITTPGAAWSQFDINYYTVLDQADLKQMHEVALISEFNITQYGRRA